MPLGVEGPSKGRGKGVQPKGVCSLRVVQHGNTLIPVRAKRSGTGGVPSIMHWGSTSTVLATASGCAE